MTTETFKSLCMLSQTKKGKHIRRYYGKLEDLLMETLDEQRNEMKQTIINKDKTIEDQNQVIKNKNQAIMEKDFQIEVTQKDLQKAIDYKNWALNKRYHNAKKGDVVYLYKDNLKDPNCDIKIGKTKDLSERESQYATGNRGGGMIYVKYCYNCHLSEKVIHHILDRYRIIRNQEWFKMNEKTAIWESEWNLTSMA